MSCTPEFLAELDEITSHKNHYFACWDDICAELKRRTVADLRISGDTIQEGPRSTVRKIRIPNSQANGSKPGGYRVLVAVSKVADEVELLYPFPKRGPLKKDNTTKEFNKLCIAQLQQARKSGTLIKLDLSGSYPSYP